MFKAIHTMDNNFDLLESPNNSYFINKVFIEDYELGCGVYSSEYYLRLQNHILLCTQAVISFYESRDANIPYNLALFHIYLEKCNYAKLYILSPNEDIYKNMGFIKSMTLDEQVYLNSRYVPGYKQYEDQVLKQLQRIKKLRVFE